MRIIDYDAALDRYYAEYDKQDICDGADDRDWLKICFDEAPEVDAVEVVRCRDCRYGHNNGYLCVKKYRGGGTHAMDKVRPGFFCADGKRRTDQ